MNWYKCDVCGKPIQLDPGDERVCSDCEEEMAMSKRQHKVARRYAGIFRLAENQYEMEEMTV